jgi:two-component system, NarL family, nitrate/nitrite response regulator NarL
MRVLLAGPAPERDRIRQALLDAGLEIVAEAPSAPAASGVPSGVDIVIAITPTRRGPRIGREDQALDLLPETLTAREREVLALLAEGLSNRGIADALGISGQTAKFHVAAIIGKLGASNRTDAVRRAVRRGLVTL